MIDAIPRSGNEGNRAKSCMHTGYPFLLLGRAGYMRLTEPFDAIRQIGY